MTFSAATVKILHFATVLFSFNKRCEFSLTNLSFLGFVQINTQALFALLLLILAWLKASKQNKPDNSDFAIALKVCCIFLATLASQGVHTMAMRFFPCLISSRSFFVTLTLRYLVPFAAKTSLGILGHNCFCAVSFSPANNNSHIKQAFLKTLNQNR